MRDYGLTTNTGSIVCQSCGLYFIPVHNEKVCGGCKKMKRGYPVEDSMRPNPLSMLLPRSPIGFLIGLVATIVLLYAIGVLFP